MRYINVNIQTILSSAIKLQCVRLYDTEWLRIGRQEFETWKGVITPVDTTRSLK